MSVHDEPLLVVRRTVPLVPDTQVTFSVTGESPRNCCVVFVGVSVHVNLGTVVANEATVWKSAATALRRHSCMMGSNRGWYLMVGN